MPAVRAKRKDVLSVFLFGYEVIGRSFALPRDSKSVVHFAGPGSTWYVQMSEWAM